MAAFSFAWLEADFFFRLEKAAGTQQGNPQQQGI